MPRVVTCTEQWLVGKPLCVIVFVSSTKSIRLLTIVIIASLFGGLKPCIMTRSLLGELGSIFHENGFTGPTAAVPPWKLLDVNRKVFDDQW